MECVLLGAEWVGEEEEHCDTCQWATILAYLAPVAYLVPLAFPSFYSPSKKSATLASSASDVKHILQTVFTKALVQKWHTLAARVRLYKLIDPLQLRVSREANDIHIATANLMYISQLLDHIFLGMYARRRIAGATAARSETIRRLGYYLAPFYQGSHVYTSEMCVAQIHCSAIADNLIE
jgi:hypothetical protein